MPITVWIAELRISPPTAHKLSRVHNLDAEEVREAAQCVRGLRGRVNDHPERGRRVILTVQVCRAPVVVVLYPVEGLDGSVWNLGSAYPR